MFVGFRNQFPLLITSILISTFLVLMLLLSYFDFFTPAAFRAVTAVSRVAPFFLILSSPLKLPLHSIDRERTGERIDLKQSSTLILLLFNYSNFITDNTRVGFF